MRSRLTALLQDAVGHSLSGCVAALHLFEESIDRSPVYLWLEFENLQAIRFSGSSDGNEVLADTQPPEPVDMEESGEIIIADLSNTPVISSNIGKQLVSVRLVGAATGHVIGVKLEFDSTEGFYVLNWGDEILIKEELPPDSEKDLAENLLGEAG